MVVKHIKDNQMRTGSTVDINDAKVIFSSSDHAFQQETDLRWRLTQALQTTLDIEKLLGTLFD